MGSNKIRLQRIKSAIISRPYLFSFIFLLYILINFLSNKTYDVAPVIFTYNLVFVIPFLTLSFLITPFLVAITINLSITKFKEMKSLSSKGEEGFTVIGIFSGVLGGACPGCFMGLFPAFLGLFGITATLGNLPFLGLEIQFLSIILLIVAIVLLTRDSVCKIKV